MAFPNRTALNGRTTPQVNINCSVNSSRLTIHYTCSASLKKRNSWFDALTTHALTTPCFFSHSHLPLPPLFPHLLRTRTHKKGGLVGERLQVGIAFGLGGGRAGVVHVVSVYLLLFYLIRPRCGLRCVVGRASARPCEGSPWCRMTWPATRRNWSSSAPPVPEGIQPGCDLRPLCVCVAVCRVGSRFAVTPLPLEGAFETAETARSETSRFRNPARGLGSGSGFAQASFES